VNCEPDNLGGKGTIVFLAVNASYSHTNLAGWYLRGYAERVGWIWHEVEVIQNDSLATALQRVLCLKPDILAVSFYLFNSNYLLSFLSRFKALMSRCLVIGGGPEFLGDNFPFLGCHPEINAVIRGEGEQAFAAWLECCREPGKWRNIKGLCALRDGNYIDNGKAELITNLDEIPSPFRSNLMDRNFSPPSRLSFRASRGISAGTVNMAEILHFVQDDKSLQSAEPNSNGFKKPFLLLETSRGCSNHCAFCTSASEPCSEAKRVLQGERVRYFSLERVNRDLSLISAAGVREVRIADRTFNENLPRGMALVKIMRDEFKNIRFHLEIDPARLSDEMIRELALAEPGRFHLEVGIQTAHAETLRAIGRFGSVERALAALNQLCRLRNLAIHVDLIAGLPGAGLADLYADLQTIALLQPDEIQLELLKVLPGTQLSGEREKFGIIAAKEPPYEILQTATMSHDDLVTAQRLSNLVDWFYNAPELKQPLIEAVKQISGFFGLFCAFCGDRAEASHAPALENRFRLLEQFCRINAPALIFKLGYAWLKWGLSAQHGICRATQWKKPLPEEAVLVEGDARATPRRIYLAELERPYLFVYGHDPRRRPCAIYVLKNASSTGDKKGRSLSV